MQAYVIHSFGDVDQLKLESIATSEPAPNEVVIKVTAVGLNPLDLNALRGGMGERIKLPAVLGTDVSGVIEKIGAGVRGFQVGDAVLGMINFPGTDGTFNGHGYGEYALSPADQIVKKPADLSFEAAAGLPAVSLTAKQALEDVGNIQDRQRVLIHGAAGGVGHMAIQIAKLHHAYIFATASDKDADFVRSIGANEVIDYKLQRFEDIAHDIDLVLDTVGGEVMRRSIDVLKPSGTLVTTRWPELASVEEIAKAKGVQARAVAVKPNTTQLIELARQVANDELRVNIHHVYSFGQLPGALQHLKAGGVQGKLVVRVGHKPQA